MAKRVWVAKMDCQMPFRDFRKGESWEFDDEAVNVRVKELFTCLTPEEVAAKKDEEKTDPDFKVMVERLKAAKIPLKRGITKVEVKKLFDEFLANNQTDGVASSVR